jgi:hypothetical protein
MSSALKCQSLNSEKLALCKEFALMTNTDTELSMMILEENEWNLERSISDYFDLIKTQSIFSSVFFWNMKFF